MVVGWWGRGGGSKVVLSFSLVVAALQVFTLNVPSTVVCARELNAILIHTPADASFAATRWLTLLALEESFSVTVGQIQRQSHYTRSVLHPLNNPIQFPPAWSIFRLMFVDGQRGVVHWRDHDGAHRALSAQLLLLLLAQCLNFFTAHNIFMMEWHFSWLQLFRNLCGHGVLMFLRVMI